MKKGYICDTCGTFNESYGQGTMDQMLEIMPWKCPVCDKEACAHCYYMYATHKECFNGKTEEEVKEIANKQGWRFE